MKRMTPTQHQKYLDILRQSCFDSTITDEDAAWIARLPTDRHETHNIPVFVYGTLKSGYSRNDVLTDRGAWFSGHAKSLSDFKLYEPKEAWYPFLVPVAPGTGVAVRGEIWMVDLETLRRLDWIEGHPDFYTRQRIRVSSGAPGEGWEVFAYVMVNSSVSHMVDCGTEWVKPARMVQAELQEATNG